MKPTLFLNCVNDGSPTKSYYLMRARDRMTPEQLHGFEIAYYKDNPQNPPQFVLNIEPYEHFKKGTVWTGTWEIDLLCDRPQLSLSDWFASDEVFTAVSTLPNHMITKDKVPIFFPQAIDPLLHKYEPMIPREVDFVVACTQGSGIYDMRTHCLRVMKANFTSLEFPRTNVAQYVRNLQRGKVQFIRSMSTPVGDGEIAQRFFEALAIGPVLTNWCPDLELTNLVEGQDYMAYRNDMEMLEAMRYLLTHPEEAEKIAKNGREKGLKYHTYEKRLEEIIMYIGPLWPRSISTQGNKIY